MRKFLYIFIGLIVAGVLVLGYFGFIPGVSSLFGSNAPRDLGVRATEQEQQAALAKTGVKLETIASATTPQESIRFAGSRSISGEYTSKEITGLLALCSWKYCLVPNGQVRINADGTVEASAILRTDRIQPMLQALGSPEPRVQAGLDALHIINRNPPIYVKGTPSVVNGRVHLNIQAVEIGRLPIPANLIATYGGEVDAMFDRAISHIPGMSLTSVTFADGKMKVDGTFAAIQAFQQ